MNYGTPKKRSAEVRISFRVIKELIPNCIFNQVKKLCPIMSI